MRMVMRVRMPVIVLVRMRVNVGVPVVVRLMVHRFVRVLMRMRVNVRLTVVIVGVFVRMSVGVIGHRLCAPGASLSSRLNVRTMRATAKAAPKPLSMFITAIPEAQLESIVLSAACPPSATPYPTDVGTAITGISTKPPTTLARAPSIPATTTTADALRTSSIL